MATGQGKFDALTKDLITHILGFKEGEENFVRSEQFVLSNLLYHHCLAVNSHAVRRSLDGLALKFTVHGQHQRAHRLNALAAQFLSSPLFKDHYETDIEWSLLSLLLHLSNNPTQASSKEVEIQSSQAAASEDVQEDVDWVAHLREGDPEFVLGPEEPLSDWSSDEDSEDGENKESFRLQPFTLHSDPPSPPEAPASNRSPASRERLEQLHRAKSWLSSKTHLQYWGSKHPQELPVSDHPAANVAKVWEEHNGHPRCCQQLSEWAVLREVVWSLMCPVSAHVFLLDTDGHFTVRPTITLPSLTPAATSSLLSYLCEPLMQLRVLDTFIQRHKSLVFEPPTAVTVQAYALGLWRWRHSFLSHLRTLEDCVKNQESTCTLLWLEGELHPWLRTLASLFTIHSKAITASPHSKPKVVAMRLLGSLCEGVEGAGEAGMRGALLRLLLHTLRYYLTTIHSWLLHGSLLDPTREFIVHRNEAVAVHDERFWREAFTASFEQDQCQNTDSKDPIQTIMKIFSPLLTLLTSVGKSQELLAALDVSPLAMQGNVSCQGQPKRGSDESGYSLEVVVVKHIKDAVCTSSQENVVEGEGSSREPPEGAGECCKKDTAVLRPSQGHPDPLLWAAFCETSQDMDTDIIEPDTDHVACMIGEIGEVSGAVSMVLLLTSTLQPIVRRKQGELSAKLTKVLLEEHRLAHHCQAVRSVLLMEAGDIMHEFYSLLFSQLEGSEGVDSIGLTPHLQYCVERLYPDLAQFFSVSLMPKTNTTEEAKASIRHSESNIQLDSGSCNETLLIEELGGSGKGVHQATGRDGSTPVHSQDTSSDFLTRAGIPELQVQYQAPWPANLFLTEPVMKQFSKLFNFILSLKRVTNGLERLTLKELSGWNLVMSVGSDGSSTEEPRTPLQSRLHRLQLLRQWLLCFSRELHDHFANTAFLPYHQAVERLFTSAPPLNTIITEHDKLLNKLTTECLMGNEKIVPLQIVLNKVFWITRRLGQLWVRDVGRVSCEELTYLETQYAQVHRYLVNFLTALVSRNYLPHMEGLTRTLVDTVPLLTHL